MSSPVALVTGSSAGVGRAAATALYAKGFHVFISGRDAKRCAAAVAAIKLDTNKACAGDLDVLPMDLTDFASVRRAASKIKGKRLELLVLNAGMLYHGSWNGPWRTKDGVDYLFAANHLGHFLLCELLLPQLKAAGGGRVVIVSSIAHWVGAEALLDGDVSSVEAETDGEARFRKSYARSKLANLLHAYELQRRLLAEGSDVTVTPAAPGLVSTDIFSAVRGEPDAYKHAPPALQQAAVPPSMGAMTLLHAALAEPAVPPMSWCVPYWTPPTYGCLGLDAIWEVEKSLELTQRRTWGVHVGKSSPTSRDAELARKLWAYSAKAVGL